MKKLTLFLLLQAFIGSAVWCQDYLTPVRTDVAGFPTWSDTDISGDVYLKLLYVTAVTITPDLNFNLFSGETLSFKARTYGGVNATENTVYISVSEDAGVNWTDIGSRTPVTTTLTPMDPFDLSSFNGTQIRIKFYVTGTSNSVGAGIDDLAISGVISGSDPTLLTADETENDVDHNLDIGFTEDAAWRAAITSVNAGGTALTETTDYLITAGTLQLRPSGGNPLLTTAGSKNITVDATGYLTALVTQQIYPGSPNANSTAEISSGLALNSASIITCTAKDQYNNPVAGYTFKYDLTVTDNTSLTDEAYTVDGAVRNESFANLNVVALSNEVGVATFNVSVPGFVDSNDGLTIQVQLADGLTNVGSPFSYMQTQTILNPGDIAFTAYQFDDPDTYAFVLLRDVAANTNIVFTDNGWTGSALTTNEGTTTWTAPDGGLPGGTLITISGNTVTGGGTAVSSPSISLAVAGDQLLAYQGSSTAPSFIAALSSPSFITSGSVTTNTTYLPAGLTGNENAFAVTPQMDNGYYNGITAGTVNYLTPAVNNPANWSTSNAIQTWPASWQFSIASVTNLTQTATVQNLTIASGESLTIQSGQGLTVTGTLMNQAGSAALVVNSGGSLLQSSPLVEASVRREVSAWTDDAHGWHFLSAPVASQSIDPEFTDPVGANYDFYQWDEPSATWLNQKVPANAITTFIPGRGYLVAYGNSGIRSFTGILNAGDVNVVNLTRSGSLEGAGWNLIGNPYPCSLTWNDGVNWMVPGTFSGVAKIWSANDASYSDVAAGETIPPMNGFMVELLSGSPATLTIPASARVHDASALWYKSTRKPEMVFVAKETAFHTAQTSVVRFDALATNGFDPACDAHFIAGYAPEFYSLAGGEKLSTNTLPDSGGCVHIPFGFKKQAGTDYSIELKSMDAVFGPALLTDLKTGNTVDLSTNPIYTFTASEGDNPERFMLTLGHVGIGDPGQDEQSGIFSFGNSIIIQSPEWRRIDVYGTNGTLEATLYPMNMGISRIQVDVPTGYYIIRAVTSNSTLVKKVFICH